VLLTVLPIAEVFRPAEGFPPAEGPPTVARPPITEKLPTAGKLHRLKLMVANVYTTSSGRLFVIDRYSTQR